MKKLLTAAILLIMSALPASAQFAYTGLKTPANEKQVREATHFFRKVTLGMGAGNLNSSSGSGDTPQPMYATGKIFSLTAPVSSVTTGATSIGVILPANTINISSTGQGNGAGKVLYVRIFGTTAANANTKVANLIFGSTSIPIQNAASNNKDFEAEATIYATGYNAQQIACWGFSNGAISNALSTTSAQANGSPINVGVTLPASTANGDVVITNLEIYGESYNP